MADSGLDIGTLSGRIELEDHFSSAVDLIGGKIDQLDEKFGGLGHTVVEQATAFFTAEAAIEAVKEAIKLTIDTIEELTMKGAKVAEIEKNFNDLAVAGGHVADVLLGDLRTATHNTVTDFELMKTVSGDLTAGMNLSDAQFRLIASGGFALAHAKGLEVADVMNTINDAMLTGRTRQLAYLTGKIDLASAEASFAKAMGTTVDHLTAEGKLEAAREAILKSVSDAQARLGEQTEGLNVKVEQVSTAWANFQEDLGKTVATSPVLMAGFDAIKVELVAAFGGTQADLIKTIAHEIDNVAITALDFAKNVVDGVAIVGVEWNAFKVVVAEVGQGIRALTYLSEELLVGLLKVASFLDGGLAPAFKVGIDAINKDMDRLYQNMSDGELKIAGYKKAEDDWAIATGKVDEAITRVQDKMKAAQKAAQDATPPEKDLADATAQAAAAAGEQAAQTAKAQYVMAQTAEEAKKLKAAQDELASSGKTWQETVAGISKDTADAVKMYLQAGVSSTALGLVYNLTAAQVKALGEAIKSETEAHKLEIKQVEDSKARWAEYGALVASISGTATEKQVADIQKWEAAQVKSHVDAKTDTKDFYDWLAQESTAMAEKADQDRLVADTHSHAYFQKLARDAQDAYDFASAHADQFTDTYIRDLEKTAVDAQKTAESWSSSLGGSLDGVAKKATALAQQVNSLNGLILSFTPKGAGTIDQFTIDSTPGGADALLNELAALSRSPVLNPKNVHTFADQTNYVNATARYNALEAAYNLLISQAKQKHSFADGGVGDFGSGTLAVLHGREAIVPLTGPGGAMGGAITNNFYVNGTAADVARQVGDHIMRTLKQQRQFGAA